VCYGKLFFTNTKLLEIDALLQYDGTVSVGHPPSTATFDPVNRRSSLHTRHRHPELASASASSSNIPGIPSDLAHLSQIITSMVSMTHTPLRPPTTPTHCRTSSSASSIRSLTHNTPSKFPNSLNMRKQISVLRTRIYMKKASECLHLALIFFTSLRMEC
jgi:hypothetical protein